MTVKKYKTQKEKQFLETKKKKKSLHGRVHLRDQNRGLSVPGVLNQFWVLHFDEL